MVGQMLERASLEARNPEGAGTVIHGREGRPRPELGRGCQNGRDAVLKTWQLTGCSVRMCTSQALRPSC